MPQRSAGPGIERDDVVRRAAGKEHVAAGAQHAGADVSLPLMSPPDLSGVVLDRLNHRHGPAAALASAPTHRIVARVVEVINTEAANRAHIQQAGERAEARRLPVRGAADIRRDERAVDLRHLRRIGDWLALAVVPFRPVRLDEFR